MIIVKIYHSGCVASVKNQKKCQDRGFCLAQKCICEKDIRIKSIDNKYFDNMYDRDMCKNNREIILYAWWNTSNNQDLSDMDEEQKHLEKLKMEDCVEVYRNIVDKHIAEILEDYNMNYTGVQHVMWDNEDEDTIKIIFSVTEGVGFSTEKKEWKDIARDIQNDILFEEEIMLAKLEDGTACNSLVVLTTKLFTLNE